ncbi:hypothetical protein CPLU01_04011 [Colletotrichum plurivorum]|uniref:Fe2OG dioxygenase domain-containing protein n=1 Tax=Colletotrichum plurivorum TaxID=2175906 RepID=A0A8H6NK94_9PEZI|nr:hypothetical protein CPLU01_04011 [Colletotrichum plurivorum]
MSAVHNPPGVAFRKPPIWADNRQALCDALTYYKAHEGSFYTKDGIVMGVLVGKQTSVRDILSNEVIITAVGGSRKLDENGNRVRGEELTKRTISILEACKSTMRKMLPVGVILGDGYPTLSVEVEHIYNVLAFFTITDVWSERDENGVRFFKIRLEKIDRSTPSWWQPEDQVQHSVRPRECPPIQTLCSLCGEVSKQVFSQGWTCLNAHCSGVLSFPPDDIQQLSFASHRAVPMAWCVMCEKGSKTIFSCGWICLNEDCDDFFHLPTGVSRDDLIYSEEYLQERTAHLVPIQPLAPRLPDATVDGFLGTEKEMRIGIVCPQCGGCSRRKCWNRWICENPDCSYVLDGRPRPYPLRVVIAEEVAQTQKSSFTTLTVAEGIPMATSRVNGYTIDQYLLPDPNDAGAVFGSVTVFRSGTKINAEAGGANDMWNQMQEETIKDFGLRRQPVVHPGLPREKLTRNFLQNWGAPYKFAVAVASKSFREAPPCIISALKRMQWAGRIAVAKTNETFKSHTQDADEGSDVVPVDLGSEEPTDFNELLSLGYMEGDRISFHDDGEDTLGPTVATLSLGSPSQMSFRLKKKFTGGKSQVLLKFPLRHGDMVVMHGGRIHRAYEHMVEPKGKRRFALTCRRIALQTLDPETRADAEEKSILPSVPENWDYPKTTNRGSDTEDTENFDEGAQNDEKRKIKAPSRIACARKTPDSKAFSGGLSFSEPFSDEPSPGGLSFSEPSSGDPSGDPSSGDPSSGDSSSGDPSYDQPSYGQPSYGQPSYGQPSYGQPSYGQPSYGQPSYGQPSYGQPSYGQPSYGQHFSREPLSGDPFFSDPSYSDPSYSDPSYSDPSYGGPFYGESFYGEPSYGDSSPGMSSPSNATGKEPACNAAAPETQATVQASKHAIDDAEDTPNNEKRRKTED